MAWPKGRSRKEFNEGLRLKSGSKSVTGDGISLTSAVHPPGAIEKIAGAIREGKLSTKPSEEQKWKMRAGNNWEGIDADREENPDRFNVPKDKFPEGMDLQWWTKMIYGQETKQRMNTAFRVGWTPVHDSDFDGWHRRILHGKFPLDDEGFIFLDGMTLCARPAEMSAKARARDKRKAEEAVALKEEAFKGKGLDVSGGDDPSALAHNKIRRSYERIEVPKE